VNIPVKAAPPIPVEAAPVIPAQAAPPFEGYFLTKKGRIDEFST
jgi:hypothetical protein